MIRDYIPLPESDELPDGVILNWLDGNCPVQGEGTVDGRYLYFRARGEKWSVEIGRDQLFTDDNWLIEVYWGAWPSAGYMSEDDARRCIAVAVVIWRTECWESSAPLPWAETMDDEEWKH